MSFVFGPQLQQGIAEFNAGPMAMGRPVPSERGAHAVWGGIYIAGSDNGRPDGSLLRQPGAGRSNYRVIRRPRESAKHRFAPHVDLVEREIRRRRNGSDQTAALLPRDPGTKPGAAAPLEPTSSTTPRFLCFVA